MCGLVGVAGNLTKSHLETFDDLLIFNQVRGPHSTGVASITRGNNPDVKMIKRIGTPAELMEFPKYKDVVSLGRKVILGHGRWATVGGIKNVNAHPFDFENVVGAHNGTLEHYARNKMEFKDDYETDSEQLYANISAFGVEAVVPKIRGAWALAWYDKAKGTLNFLRNDERPLCFVHSEDGDTMFWASEAAMLHAALGRRGVRYGKVMMISTDHHLSWEIPDWGKKFKEPVIKPLEGARPFQAAAAHGKTKSTTSHTPGGRGELAARESYVEGVLRRELEERAAEAKKDTPPFKAPRSIQPGLFGTPAEPSPEVAGAAANSGNKIVVKLDDFREKGKADDALVDKLHSVLSEPADDEDIPLPPLRRTHYKDHKGHIITQTEFDRITRAGCSWCSRNVHWGQNVKFLDYGEFVCDICLDDPEFKMYIGDSK